MLIRLLQSEYCPPIDSSLFSAIISDYDLSNLGAIDELRATLDILKESTLAEESASFDPSGSSGLQDNGSSHESSNRAKSWHSDIASEGTENTDLTGMTQTLRVFDFDGHRLDDGTGLDRDRHDAELEDLSPLEKSEVLKEMFTTAKDFDINYTLKKVDNNFGRAVEELLNQAFLEEEGLRDGGSYLKKGIDAFAEPAVTGRGRRGRKKKKQLTRRSSSTPTTGVDSSSKISSPSSRWDRAKEDVDFITQRTYISPKVVSSVYHKNSGSLAATIEAFCRSTEPDLNPNPYMSMASPSILEAHAAELSVDFQCLPYSKLAALVRLTHPSTASAHELARALTSQSGSNSSMKIIPQYLGRPPSPDSTPTTLSLGPMLPLSQPSATALAIARSNAFTQAQSAYRKSKSTPLMGGAASYYSSVGRDASASLRRHEAAAAEALVASQSRPGEVDLHGTTVKDAVNIARARVENWWDREGREWARQGKAMGGGLRVITGAGRHSEGGRGRLGPAVGGMLVREGWKVEIGNGLIDVVGRARK